MYSVLMSRFNEGFIEVKEELKKLINENSNVVIIPWTFASELKTKNIDEFFTGERKESYLTPLHKLGVKSSRIIVLDCYNHSKEKMINSINKSDVIIFTGGNPEMLFKKVNDAGIIDCLQNYKKVIIGSSAGAELQLKKYFITKKNNYYKKFAWYDGFGIINNDFYFDVHSTNRGRYLSSLKEKSKMLKKNIYCLFDSGVIIYNRENKTIKCYGKYIKY